MINATQIRKGMVLDMNGVLFRVLEANYVNPGNWKGMVHTRLRNLTDQSIQDHRFRSEDRVEQAYLEEAEMEFLFQSGEEYVFMNRETFDQVGFPRDVLGDGVFYLVPNIVFIAEFHQGRPIGIRPPLTVELKVVQTEPFLKGATQSASNKPAVLETGLQVSVPQFIKEGDLIRLDTRENSYIERAKSA
ncbi:MAG: elongation factor P [Candidatus Aminicenantes bacterium]|nr:elongation factor P [Candidatus Aminicenantes bacterium]